jgi:hypothetical protein
MGFADPMGQNIWGEPSFGGSGDFMLFTRFDTRESACWSSGVLFAEGSVVDGFEAPIVLN